MQALSDAIDAITDALEATPELEPRERAREIVRRLAALTWRNEKLSGDIGVDFDMVQLLALMQHTVALEILKMMHQGPNLTAAITRVEQAFGIARKGAAQTGARLQ